MSQVRTQQYPEGATNPIVGPSLYSAAALMEWLYRIKVWRHEFNLTLDGSPWLWNGTYDVPARSIMTDGVITFDGPATERDVVLVAIPTGAQSYGGYIEFTGVDGLFCNLCRLFDITIFEEAQIGWKAEVFFGASNLTNNPNAFPGSTFHPATAAMGINYPNPVSTITIPLYESDPIVPAADRWSGDYTITPIEWWPYAPTSGGDPVFDSTTGAQINPNVVID